MFVSVHGTNFDVSQFKDTSLVMPCHSAGLSPFIGLDLYLLNEGMTKVGYFKSENIVAGVSNDGLSLTPEEGNLILPAEVYFSAEQKMTFLIIRSGVHSGKMRAFGDELSNFIKSNQFSNVVVLTSTMSPVQRERNTNRLIPEIFAYVSNSLYDATNKKYYDIYGIRKFGYWIEDVKKKPHQELDELMGGG